MTTSIDQWLEALTANGERMAAIRTRIVTDARYRDLKDHASDLFPRVADGMQGGRQSFSYLLSPACSRRNRALALASARENQLRGIQPAVKHFLSKASAHRRDEKNRNAFGLSPRGMAAVTGNPDTCWERV